MRGVQARGLAHAKRARAQAAPRARRRLRRRLNTARATLTISCSRGTGRLLWYGTIRLPIVPADGGRADRTSPPSRAAPGCDRALPWQLARSTVGGPA